MQTNLSEQQELLLYKACKDNNGTVTMELARRMYSSKNSAKSAVQKLQVLGFIEQSGIGAFKVTKLTTDVEEELAHIQEQEQKNDEEETKVDTDGSKDGYQMQKVT